MHEYPSEVQLYLETNIDLEEGHGNCVNVHINIWMIVVVLIQISMHILILSTSFLLWRPRMRLVTCATMTPAIIIGLSV